MAGGSGSNRKHQTMERKKDRSFKSGEYVSSEEILCEDLSEELEGLFDGYSEDKESLSADAYDQESLSEDAYEDDFDPLYDFDEVDDNSMLFHQPGEFYFPDWILPQLEIAPIQHYLSHDQAFFEENAPYLRRVWKFKDAQLMEAFDAPLLCPSFDYSNQPDLPLMLSAVDPGEDSNCFAADVVNHNAGEDADPVVDVDATVVEHDLSSEGDGDLSSEGGNLESTNCCAADVVNYNAGEDADPVVDVYATVVEQDLGSEGDGDLGSEGVNLESTYLDFCAIR